MGNLKVRDDIVTHLNELFKDDIWVPDWILGDEKNHNNCSFLLTGNLYIANQSLSG